MSIVNALRLRCGHDSRSVEGCLDCEAADEIERLRSGPVRSVPIGEIAIDAQKLRMCYFDENGELCSHWEPTPEDLRAHGIGET